MIVKKMRKGHNQIKVLSQSIQPDQAVLDVHPRTICNIEFLKFVMFLNFRTNSVHHKTTDWALTFRIISWCVCYSKLFECGEYADRREKKGSSNDL